MPRKPAGNPTIADVARESGVGTMTVSRVVNGGKLVSAATAARVRAAIDKLGYEPNEAARILKGQAPRTLGLIVPDLADTFFSICAHAVQQMAAKHGYMTLLLASERDRESEARELAMMKSRNIAGILIVPSSAGCIGQLRELRARGIPVVMLDRTFPGLDAGEVMVENREGTKKAINHLFEHGHRNILCIGYDSEFNSIAQRMQGYESAMTDAGLKPQFAVVKESALVGPQVLKRLRSSKPPSALFTLNNVTTTQVLSMLQRENIHIPQEVAIIGFDDFELAPLLAVPLTAVRQPAAELGRSATRLLLERVHSHPADLRPARTRIVLPTELVIRRSCGCEAIRKIANDGTRPLQ
ncbi:MAG TPA: LacI family DNA-binding transcriptional regulator [Terriglobales bacterium]|nr:LacI family DNA-binding transcriptional regulator [Terriglobales bacterium]